MRSRIVLASAVLVALGMSLLPARAGQYSVEVEVLQGASAEGILTNGGKARISIGKLQGAEFFGPGAVIPNSGSVDLPILYGSFPTVSGQEQPARYIGCIQITAINPRTKKMATDGNCAQVRATSDPSSATFDPILENGSVTFSVPSTMLPGYFLTATAMLDATTDPQPVPNAKPQVTSVGGTPRRAELHSTVTFTRNASLIGSVRSPIIGGGVFKKVTRAQMFGGTASVQVADRTMPFCMSPTGTVSKPGDMPWNQFPPEVWIPKPPRVRNFDPNNPRYDAQNPPAVETDTMPYQPTRICPADV